jgi:hypothetical protein
VSRRPDSPLNAYLRVIAAVLDDAERELSPTDAGELAVLLDMRLRRLLRVLRLVA